MGWENREYGREDGGSGRFRDAVRRMFGEGENPLAWSIPLYRAWGIGVRIHLIFVLMIASELIMSLVQRNIGFPYVAMGMASLFLLVLLHEYGHCIACRWAGGEANQILMWPLGGLASCMPPPGWRASLITTLGGPAVNALLWPILGAILFALVSPLDRWSALVFNPFNPAGAMGYVYLRDGTQPYWLYAIWWAYYINALLFCFNMLFVMYPLDGARVVQALLWSRLGERKASAMVVNIGLLIAAVVFVVAITSPSGGRLVALALFGGITCWIERQRLAITGHGEHPALAGYDFERGYRGMPGDAEERRERKARAEDAPRRSDDEDQAELDRILAKIAKSGMGSLTTSEKRWLQRATERRRRA